jgi:hypothetical protein
MKYTTKKQLKKHILELESALESTTSLLAEVIWNHEMDKFDASVKKKPAKKTVAKKVAAKKKAVTKK